MTELIGIIPAAGKGTRLLPYNAGKELLPVGSREVVINGESFRRPKVVSEYIIESMSIAGVKKLIFVINPNKYNLINLHLDGSKYGMSIAYISQNTNSMLHSINLAYEWIKIIK